MLTDAHCSRLGCTGLRSYKLDSNSCSTYYAKAKKSDASIGRIVIIEKITEQGATL